MADPRRARGPANATVTDDGPVVSAGEGPSHGAGIPCGIAGVGGLDLPHRSHSRLPGRNLAMAAAYPSVPSGSRHAAWHRRNRTTRSGSAPSSRGRPAPPTCIVASEPSGAGSAPKSCRDIDTAPPDVFLGYLSNGPDNGLNAGDTFTITPGHQQPGANLIRFDQKVPGWTWGVTGLLLTF